MCVCMYVYACIPKFCNQLMTEIIHIHHTCANVKKPNTKRPNNYNAAFNTDIDIHIVSIYVNIRVNT